VSQQPVTRALWATLFAALIVTAVAWSHLITQLRTAEARVELLSAALARCAEHRDRLSRECGRD
jgi:hypothetical protein